MKRILASLTIVAVMALSATGATSAYFTDTEEMTGLTFSTGNANLKLTQSYVGTWFDGNATASQLAVSLPDDLYPGYEGSWGDPDGVIYLGNFSASPVNLVVSAKVTNYTSDNALLDDTVQLAFAWGGSCDPSGVGTGFHSISWWRSNAMTLFTGAGTSCGYIPNDHSDGYGGYARAIKMYLKVPTSASDTITGSTASFNVHFDAEQQH